MSTNPPGAHGTWVLSPPLQPGELLGHFRIDSLLGRGGMGAVYRAHDSKLHRPVAVKVLPPALTGDSEWKTRLLQEACAAARINHPSVAQVYAADEANGTPFVVMEFVEGQTLRELLAAGPIDLLRLVDISIQLAEGIARAHELGVVHRDLKPANIMLTGRGAVKILDFGLAKLLDAESRPGQSTTLRTAPSSSPLTIPGTVLGTPAYMSPEQARGSKVDARTDLFAIGVLLYELATGQNPFQRPAFLDTLHAVGFEDPPLLRSIRPEIPPALERLAERCLKKQPEERPKNAAEIADELRVLKRSLRGEPASGTSWGVRIGEFLENIKSQPPSRYAWLLVAVLLLGGALYLVRSINNGGLLIMAAVVLFLIFRYIRNQPHRLQDRFVRRISRLPDVRLITFKNRHATVVVDRPEPHLYARVNSELGACNRKLYWGSPLTASIVFDLSSDQLHTMLTTPGVQYLREETGQ